MSFGLKEKIEENLISIIDDLVQDWDIDMDDGITGSTSLVKDLDFASVDIIQLCVAIEQSYGKKIGFQSLLMKEGCYVEDLTVGEIAGFLTDKV